MTLTINHFDHFRQLILFTFLLVELNVTAQQGMVKGKVSDSIDVLPGATVLLGNKACLSDANGVFEFSVQPGIYFLVISHTGYRIFEKQIEVVERTVMDLDVILQSTGTMENIIILGSRSRTQRSNLNTPVPVDVIPVSILPARQPELTRIIGYAVPSFNASPHGFLSGKHMVPASLRGLSPDQTLVLLNGRRRHTMASPWTGGAIGVGTVGTDLNAIPSAAIEKIEVLRDGASAQYGSDAIAGVINLRLKESTGITSIHLNAGQYYEGDGEAISFSVNRGYDFLKKGFLNFTAQFRFNNYTQRNGLYDSTVYYRIPNSSTPAQLDSLRKLDNKKILARGFDRYNHRPLGDNQVYNTALAMNGGYALNQSTSLFWTAVWNYRFVKDPSSNQFRFPKDSAAQINMQLYPDGFLPQLESKIPDLSIIGGIKGNTKSGWQWDAGMIFGKNSGQVEVYNTNNASQYMLGAAAPTRFYTGKQSFSQLTNNFNIGRELLKKPKKVQSMHLSFGAEWRVEQYSIEEGEEASWKNYSPASGKQGGAQGLSGFQPENAIDKGRHVLGAYSELEVVKNKRFLMNLATRYEYYSDYGSNIAGKLAFAYKIFKHISWRGSVSNGFRAPALQQRYYSLVTTMTGTGGILLRGGTFRNESAVAEAFGIAPLKQEKAINISSGFTSAISKNVSVTIDGYWIQIRDRIIYGGSIRDTFPEVKQILTSFHFNDVQVVRFFSNAINTETTGLDIVIESRWPLGRSFLEASLAANINSTRLDGAVQYAKSLPNNEQYRTLLVNREEKCRVEDVFPSSKIILNLGYKTGRWAINPTFTRYGEVTQKQNVPAAFPDQTFSPKIISSINIRFDATTWLSVTAGGENVFDVYPDPLSDRKNTQGGLLKYSPNFAPFGCNGGYYYLNMAVSWEKGKK